MDIVSFLRLSLWSCLLFGLMASFGFVSPEEPLVLDDVIEGLKRSETLFLEESESFQIVYAREKSENLEGGGDLLTAEWTLAHKGDKWLIQRRFLRPGKRGKVTIPAEPNLLIADADRILEWDQGGEHCAVDRSQDRQNAFSGWYYFRNLGLNVYKYIAESGGLDYEKIQKEERHQKNLDHPFLPEFLQVNRSNYRLLPDREEVDGVSCCVLEWAGMDRVWIDPEHGFAIRRRAYHWGPGDQLKYEIFNRDFREVKPGLWLPFTQAVDKYGSIDVDGEGKRLLGKIINKSVYVVRKLEFDNVEDDFFEVNLPPGTEVNDSIRKMQYHVAREGGNPLEGPISQGMGLLRWPAYRKWIVIVSALLILFVAGWLLVSRTRTSTPAKKA